MKHLYLSLFLICQLYVPLQAVEHFSVPKPESYSVYFFLGEECIISQQYTLLLKRLFDEYANEEISFTGLFPNPSSNDKKIAIFKEKYQLPFELKHDALQREMDRFGVQVTPEVVVFQHRENKVIYQGRIDNTFYKIGKRRTITTTSELEDVLKLINNKKIVEANKTEAIGCLITPLSSGLKNIPMCKPTIEKQ